MDLTIIIDNYDSFVYNVAQYVGELGSRPPVVVRNDEVSVKALERMRPDRLIISPPGPPGSPPSTRGTWACRGRPCSASAAAYLCSASASASIDWGGGVWGGQD